MVLLQLVWSRAYRKDFLNKNNIIIKPRYNDYSVAFFSYSVDMYFFLIGLICFFLIAWICSFLTIAQKERATPFLTKKNSHNTNTK